VCDSRRPMNGADSAPDETGALITCETCGSTEWRNAESFSGVDIVTLGHFANGVTIEREGRKYDAEMEDVWECENGHEATDDQDEALNDLFSVTPEM